MLGRVGKGIVGTGVVFAGAGFVTNRITTDPEFFMYRIDNRIGPMAIGDKEPISLLEKRVDVFTRSDCNIGSPNQEEYEDCVKCCKFFSQFVFSDLIAEGRRLHKSFDEERIRYFLETVDKTQKKFISLEVMLSEENGLLPDLLPETMKLIHNHRSSPAIADWVTKKKERICKEVFRSYPKEFVEKTLTSLPEDDAEFIRYMAKTAKECRGKVENSLCLTDKNFFILDVLFFIGMSRGKIDKKESFDLIFILSDFIFYKKF